MVEDLKGDVSPEDLFERIKKTAIFVRSVLHLPFPALESVNPSFSIMSKYCDLLAALLKENSSNNAHCGHASKLADILKDIAGEIVDRDDKGLIDCMAMLDQFLNDTH